MGELDGCPRCRRRTDMLRRWAWTKMARGEAEQEAVGVPVCVIAFGSCLVAEILDLPLPFPPYFGVLLHCLLVVAELGYVSTNEVNSVGGLELEIHSRNFTPGQHSSLYTCASAVKPAQQLTKPPSSASGPPLRA